VFVIMELLSLWFQKEFMIQQIFFLYCQFFEVLVLEFTRFCWMLVLLNLFSLVCFIVRVCWWLVRCVFYYGVAGFVVSGVPSCTFLVGIVLMFDFLSLYFLWTGLKWVRDDAFFCC
jgi:hypothetical protein